MNYKIRVYYINNQLHETENVLLDHLWSDTELGLVKSNIKRIREHYKWRMFDNQKPEFALKYEKEKMDQLKFGIFLSTDHKGREKYFEAKWLQNLNELSDVVLIKAQ